MTISTSALSHPSIRTLPIVTSIVRVLPGGIGTPSVWRSVTSAAANQGGAQGHPHARIILSEVLRCSGARVLWCAVLLLVAARGVAAQVLPEEPISLAGGHVVLGAEVSATFAPEDPGFSTTPATSSTRLRNFRMGVSAEIRANDHVQVLGEVRLDHGRVLEAYGLFVRVRPWPSRRFDIQAGRIPPTFGAMSRTAYGSSNILIGQPLAYQYLRRSGRMRCRPPPTICCACAAAAGCRASRSATTSTVQACRSSTPAAGTPASRRTA